MGASYRDAGQAEPRGIAGVRPQGSIHQTDSRIWGSRVRSCQTGEGIGGATPREEPGISEYGHRPDQPRPGAAIFASAGAVEPRAVTVKVAAPARIFISAGTAARQRSCARRRITARLFAPSGSRPARGLPSRRSRCRSSQRTRRRTFDREQSDALADWVVLSACLISWDNQPLNRGTTMTIISIVPSPRHNNGMERPNRNNHRRKGEPEQPKVGLAPLLPSYGKPRCAPDDNPI
jgi:hypothetical protein